MVDKSGILDNFLYSDSLKKTIKGGKKSKKKKKNVDFNIQ